jgi:hypothetical protein
MGMGIVDKDYGVAMWQLLWKLELFLRLLYL